MVTTSIRLLATAKCPSSKTCLTCWCCHTWLSIQRMPSLIWSSIQYAT